VDPALSWRGRGLFATVPERLNADLKEKSSSAHDP
jgi:hypothetical protein